MKEKRRRAEVVWRNSLHTQVGIITYVRVISYVGR